MPSADPPAVLGLLGEPVRWELLDVLRSSDRRVGELVDLLGKPQNLISYHLRTLRDGGLVRSRRSTADGRDIYYRADLRACSDQLVAAAAVIHPGVGLVPAAPPATAPARARVLFLCTGNSARSQIAEAFVQHLSQGAVHARSAGSHPKPLHPHAVRVMALRGIDIAEQQPKSLERFTRTRFDRVITLCDKVREVCPEFPGATPAHWSVADPAAASAHDASLEVFEQVADEIEERVTFLLADLKRTGKGTQS